MKRTILIIIAAAGVSHGWAGEGFVTPTPFDEPRLAELGRGAPVRSAVTPNYDVRKYTIVMDVDDQQHTVDATTTVRLESTEAGITQVALDFTTALTVTRVTRDGTPVSYNHAGDVLTVTLDRPMGLGEIFNLAVEYNGTPGTGFHFTSTGVYTATCTDYSRNWFPCYDDPADKADEVELQITCRDDWYCAANGALVGREPAAAGRLTYHWRESYPIATYLIAITCADYYRGFNQTWNGMPVNYYVYANQAGSAPIFFEHQPDMLDCFAARFGNYPFFSEKYAVAAIQGFVWGGMENQTITHLLSSYIGPNHSGDHVLAHELSHSWWGDRVTCGTWMDLWLNEGQGTYCDALYTEYAEGDAAFRARMQYFANLYFQEDAQHRFPIYDPEELWGATVYEKGGWIMHMLRRVLGDQAFYQAWNNYGTAHAYGNAVTADLQDEFEAVYGADLGWFFDQWVYKAGYPEFKFSWSTSNNGRTVDVVIDQIQTTNNLTPLFRCPVDLTFTTAGGPEHKEAVWVWDRHHTFRFTYAEAVTGMYFDREVWLLHKQTDGTGVVLDYFRAQPATPGVAVSWAAPAEAGLAGFNLYRERRGGRDAGARARVNGRLITGRSPYRFLDADAAAGDSCRYWLEAVELSGARTTYGPVDVRLPARTPTFALAQNYPNPARGRTTFRFTLPAASPVSLAIYDLAGREVWRTEGTFPEGENDVPATLRLAPGVYVYRLTAGGDAATRRLVMAE